MCGVKVWYAESKWKSYDDTEVQTKKKSVERMAEMQSEKQDLCSSLFYARWCSQVCRSFAEIVIKPRIHATVLAQFWKLNTWDVCVGVHLGREFGLDSFGKFVECLFGGGSFQFSSTALDFGLLKFRMSLQARKDVQSWSEHIWTFWVPIVQDLLEQIVGLKRLLDDEKQAFWWNGMICWKSKHVSTLPFCCQPRLSFWLFHRSLGNRKNPKTTRTSLKQSHYLE